MRLKELDMGNGETLKANYNFAGAGLYINLAF